MYTKQVLEKIVKIVHMCVLFSESDVSQIWFEFTSTSNYLSSNLRFFL